MSNAAHWPLRIAITASVAASAVCSAILHQASERGEAVVIVPVAVLWGAVVVGLRERLTTGTSLQVLGVALLVRALLVGTPPLLSDDLYRYLFEGEALWAGHNPLLAAPVDLEGLDDELLGKVNHPEVSTVYPPVALAWFRLLAIAGTPWAVQLGTAAIDAFTPLALLVATRRKWTAWLYALHPLAALESAHSGHLDVVAIGLAAWGVAAFRGGRPIAASTVFLAGGGLKFLPLALLPRPLSTLRSAWPVAVWIALGLTLGAPWLEAGIEGLSGLRRYAGEWAFNPLALPLVRPWFGTWTRPLLVATGALVSLAALRHRDPGRSWVEIGTAFVALSPTVHPWYVLWAVVPGLACGSARWAAAAVAYLPAYLVLLTLDPETGRWAEAPWLPLVTWAPALVVFASTYSRSE